MNRVVRFFSVNSCVCLLSTSSFSGLCGLLVFGVRLCLGLLGGYGVVTSCEGVEVTDLGGA